MECGKLAVTRDGHVILDGAEIRGCTYLAIKIDPGTALEVELRAVVDGVDVEYGAITQNPLRSNGVQVNFEAEGLARSIGGTL